MLTLSEEVTTGHIHMERFVIPKRRLRGWENLTELDNSSGNTGLVCVGSGLTSSTANINNLYHVIQI